MATITPMFVGILIAGSIEKATISQIFPVMYTAMAVFAIAFFVLFDCAHTGTQCCNFNRTYR